MARGHRLVLALAALAAAGCAGYDHDIQWDARDQIWAPEASQVKVRASQSRTFDGLARTDVLEAVVDTLQDLDFQIEVFDTKLGVVSGKKFDASPSRDVTYMLYDAESLVLFSKSYRTWGPFQHRSDLVRITVTVREAGGGRLIVRAAVQHELRPIESAEPYQAFYRTLEQSLFVGRELAGR